MKTFTGLRRVVAAATSLAAIAAVTLTTAGSGQAASSDAGLYGAADPTYDGVFRQSLAIMGQAVQGITPPGSAVSWLLDQQCADGSFQAYRADTSQPCSAPDPADYTGPDINSTAMAMQAFMSLDTDRTSLTKKQGIAVLDAADKAAEYLAKAQNRDGGWPYYAGSDSDANSTGLALAALNTQAPNFSYPAYRKASRFLGTLSSSCPDGGGFAYMAGSKADGSATAQGTVGLVGALLSYRQPQPAVAAPCANTAKAKGVSYLAKGLRGTGLLESSMGGPDYTSTAMAVIALAQARQGRASITKGLRALKANTADYVTPSTGTNPGAAGLLMLVASTTGAKASSFGGLNLNTTLNASLRK